MTIEDYSFGRIKIDGRTYTSDVIIFPDRVKDAWWLAKTGTAVAALHLTC